MYYTSKEIAANHNIKVGDLKFLRDNGVITDFVISRENGLTFLYNKSSIDKLDLREILNDARKKTSVYENMKKFYENNGFVISAIVKDYLDLSDLKLRKLDESKLLNPVRVGKFFMYDFDEVKDMLKNKQKEYQEVVSCKKNYSNRMNSCLFDMLSTDDCIEFQRLVKLDKSPLYIRLALGISKSKHDKVLDKIKFLKGE